MFVPGKDRVGGFYGRYSGGSSGAGERKFHDVDVDDATVSAGGTIAVDSLVKIAQGITESTRIGRKCTVKELHCRYQITLPTQDAVGTPVGGDTVRVIVYQDKQTNGATAAASDILETDDFQSFYNLANSSRFNILMDKNHTLDYMTLASDSGGVVSSSATRSNHVFNKLCSVPVEYNAVSGSIGTIKSNNFGILLVGQTGVAGFNSKWRIRFSDAAR